HLSMGEQLHHVDVLYGIGVRLAGLTYMRKSAIGDGQYERTDCGLSDFGVEVVQRMNEIGMAIDLSHAGSRTALEAIQLSRLPAAYLDGLESPADGSNIIRGLITRGYEDKAIRQIAGLNALDFLRRVIG